MRIVPAGAAGGVTGSCFLLEVDGGRVLVDCGLFQGPADVEALNRAPCPFPPDSIRAVLLTHAHMDHAGLLPRLVRDGFQGPIFATQATIDLCAAMLADSARIQEEDAEVRTRKALRMGQPAVEPLYRPGDVERTMPSFRPVSYGETFEAIPEIRARYRDAGHILGSAHIETFVRDGAAGGNSRERTVVFSGDIGRSRAAILRDPDPPPRADVLLMESTYGDRVHETGEQLRKRLHAILSDAAQSESIVLIPAFAVGRTQELLYALREMKASGALPIHSIFVDSPLGALATDAYARHVQLYDAESRAMAPDGDLFTFPGVRFTRTVEESRKLNDLRGPAIIIASSGMAEGGRVLHHLKHRLWGPQNHVVFSGYQAQGTLGRRIVDGAKYVRVHGEEILVRAKVHRITGLSAHADRDGLLAWASALEAPPELALLVHGEPPAASALRGLLGEKLGWRVTIPARLESFTV